MIPEIEIRRAITADARNLVKFNLAIARETENKTLAADVVDRGVQGLLQNPGYGFYLVATRAEQAIGTLMVTSEWSDWRDGLFWWIQSVYVTPEERGKGVYRALYTEVLELARSEPGICGLRLYVEKDNTGAQQVYRSLGMADTGYLVFEELL